MWNTESIDRVSFTWSSDLPLKLSVSGPSGLIKSYDAATSGSDTLATDDGVLYFTWLNTNSVSASLEYGFDTETVGERAIMSMFAAVLVVVAAVVVGMIVVVLLVVRSLNRSSSGVYSKGPVPPPPLDVRQGYSAALMDRCPGCGSKVDPSTRICPGCGARVL
ncbi:MAG: zinc ribbon domain-containing protein [Candidatus Thermoplasmatota archaeon]|nr:zinc ribbon domain-containing protein [Candidatus Thermoplasmatota archaeon]